MNSQQYDLVRARLSEFLQDALPELSPQWWTERVVPYVSPEMRAAMSKFGPRPLYTLDLASLLHIAEKNWRDLTDAYGFCRRAFCLIKHLQHARNDYAHRAGTHVSDQLLDEYDRVACAAFLRLLDSAAAAQVA